MSESESDFNQEVRTLFAEDARRFLAQMETASATLLDAPLLNPKSFEALKSAASFRQVDDAAQTVRGSASSVDADFLAESASLVEELARRGEAALALTIAHAQRAHALASFCADATREMRAMLNLYVDDAAEEASWLSMVLSERGSEAKKTDDESRELLAEMSQGATHNESPTVRPAAPVLETNELATSTSKNDAPKDDDAPDADEFAFEDPPESERLDHVFQAEAREVLLAVKGHVESFLRTRTVGALDSLEPLLNTLKGSAASVELPYLSAQAAETYGLLGELRRLRVGPVVDKFFDAVNKLLGTVALAPLSPALLAPAARSAASDVPDVFVAELQRTIEAATTLADRLGATKNQDDVEPLASDAAKLFHRLKGTSLIVGAPMIADEASALMTACKNLVDGGMLSVAIREGAERLTNLLPQAAAASTSAFDDPLPPLGRTVSQRPSEHPNFISDGLLAIFREEIGALVPSIVENLERLSGSPRDPIALEALHRLFHTVKGTAAAVGQHQMSAGAASLEDRLEAAIEDSSRATAELVEAVRIDARIVLDALGLAGSLQRVKASSPEIEIVEELSSDDLEDEAFDPAAPIIDAQLDAIDAQFDALDALAREADEQSPVPPKAEPAPEPATGTLKTDADWAALIARSTAAIAKLAGAQATGERVAELDEIFNEEMEQLAPSLAETLEQLTTDPTNPSPIRDIERILHTLKGSAATVERKDLSAAAEVLRGTFEEVGAAKSLLTPERIATLRDLVEALLTAASRVSAPDSGSEPQSGAEFAFDEPVPPPDDELLKIFQQEARESLIALQGHVETLLTTPQSVYATEYIERLFHTLKGAAATVGLTDIAKRAAELQERMEGLLSEKRTPTPAFMESLLSKTNELLTSIGVAPLVFNRGTDSGVSDPSMASAHQSSDDVERKIFTGEVKSICRQASGKAREILSATEAATHAQLRGDLADLFHRLKGTAATVGANSIAHEAERASDAARGKLPVRDLVEVVRATIVRIADLAGFERVRRRPGTVEQAVREQVQVPEDPELWEAFNQECSEILDGLEKIVLSLEEVAQPKQVVEEIFRLTHTLKGAVNTVGLSPTGKVLHVTEDFLEELLAAPIMPPMRTVTGILVEVIKEVRQNLRTARSGWVDTSAGSILALIDAAKRPKGRRSVDTLEKSSLTSDRAMVSMFDSAALFGTVGFRNDKSGNGSHPSVRSANDSADSNVGDERAYIRVATSRLDSLMNLAGELVVSRSRLSNRVGALRFLYAELGRSRVRLTSTVETFREQYEFANLGGGKVGGAKELRRLNQPRAEGETEEKKAARAPGREVFGELELDEYEDIHVLSRSLAEIGNDFEEAFRTVSSELANFSDDADSLGGIISGIQGEVTRARMVPLDAVFARLRFPVRDAATRDGKDVTIVTEGADVNIDKTIADAILQPMLHLVRNAVAHGVETPQRRTAAGKPALGTIRLTARQQSGQIVIEVADDGGGLDLPALRARGIIHGLIGQEVAVDDPRVKDLVFAAGLSTKEVVGDVSGRGVGGEVVKRSIERLNGAIRVETTAGKGTVFTITLPLTLAITRALLVKDRASTYAIPLYFAERILDPEMVATGKAANERRILLDGTYHRVRALAEYLEDVGPPSRGPALVLRVGDERLVLQVDAVIGQEEIVVKKAGELLDSHPLFAGVTLRGTGELVLIMDVPGLLNESGRNRRTDDVAGPTRSVPSTPPKGKAKARAEAPAPPAKEGRKTTAKEEPAKKGKAAPAASPTVVAKPPPLRRERAAPTTSLGGVRALVVDDSLSVRKVAEAHLRGLGVEVSVAVDGVDGLAKLREGSFDVVFTDLEMPRMHGYDFIRQMRLMPIYQALPVVVVSSRSGQKHQDHARSVGATDYLTKPFSAQSLESTIRKWLKK